MARWYLLRDESQRHELRDHATETPAVVGRAVSVILRLLGRFVRERTSLAANEGRRARQTKVREFQFPFPIDQQVLRFQISARESVRLRNG